MQNSQKGSTLIELIMVMFLLIIFGASTSILIYSGGRAQENILSERNSQIDARIVLSYLNMFIRQNDVAGKILIQENNITGDNSIVIQVREETFGYDVWIFWAEGFIYEAITDPGEYPDLWLSERIAEVDFFNTELSDGFIINTIRYNINGEEQELSSSIYLRSSG